MGGGRAGIPSIELGEVLAVGARGAASFGGGGPAVGSEAAAWDRVGAGLRCGFGRLPESRSSRACILSIDLTGGG